MPHIERIDGSTFFAPDTLFGDFIGDAKGTIRSAVGDFTAGSDDWARQGPARVDGGLVDAMVGYNRAIGAASDVVERVARLRAGAVGVVVTGQQPGALGGPLMTLYKIETAIALAERLERDGGGEFLAIYWMGGDDDDFAEVRETALPSPKLETVSASIASDAHEPGRPVGGVGVEAVRAVWNAVSGYTADHPGAGVVSEAVARALDASADHGGVTARLVAELTDGRVAVFDARAPELRTATRELILRYFDEEDVAKTDVRAAGDRLEDAGFHAQLSPGADSGVFVDEDGRRGKVSPDRRDAARRRIEEDVTCAFPGVILRNLVQDAAFGPAAVVLGPAEVAYRAQIAGLYGRFGVGRPVVFPRLFATALPAAVRDIAGLDPESSATLLRAPEDVVRVAYARSVDGDAAAARDRLVERVGRECDAFLESARAAMDPSQFGKLEKRFADVRRRVEQAASAVEETGRASALTKWPFLEALPGFLLRRGEPQERFLSMLTPFLFAGDAAREPVRDAARAHVDDALDGRLNHIVYSV